MDSLEGGNRYRQAIYGTDTRGQPVRNLIRHKREYSDTRETVTSTPTYLGGQANGIAGLVGDASDAGGWGNASPFKNGAGSTSDYAARATDNDYELRRARTPVPTFVSEVVGIHLGKIYAEEVERDYGKLVELEEWATDVDGIGTTLDEWMSETIAPLLMTLGQLDIVMAHPPRDPMARIATRADELRLGLDRCVASYILPENLVWWRLTPARRYAEVLVKEYSDPDMMNNEIRWRHWIGDHSTLYDSEGIVINTTPHRFGSPPIRRLFDRRKGRCKNVGKPRYEGIAERQREYYNRDSELILSDTVQAHPLMQGPEDYVQADGTLPIGPSWLLPKKKNTQGGSTSYEGFSVIEFPKEGADSLRKNKADIRDDVDRDGGLTKPAGAAGTDGKTVSQSGVSKELDSRDGNARLTHICRVLARSERELCELALVVLKDDPGAIELIDGVVIAYPTVFDLVSSEELMKVWTAFLGAIAQASSMVETNLVAFTDFIHKALPGRSDEFYQEAKDEIRAELEENARRSEQALGFDRPIESDETDLEDKS